MAEYEQGNAPYRSIPEFLDLVEELPKHPEYTTFEKILLASRRAKDLHNEDRASLAEVHHRSAAYQALQEIKEGVVRLAYREEEPAPQITDDESEEEEE